MDKYEKNARIFKAFCDPNRLKIIHLLQIGELCGCKLLEQLNIGQPTLSHHMKILIDAGIVKGFKDGKWMHYSLDIDGFKNVKNILDDIMKDR